MARGEAMCFFINGAFNVLVPRPLIMAYDIVDLLIMTVESKLLKWLLDSHR